MKYVVDRIESDIAVCEDENLSIVNIPLSVLPKGAKEGSVILFNDGAYSLSLKDEEERRNKLFNLMEDLFSE